MKVEYNGITIEYASITDWNETVEYDSSGMNLIANRIELTIEGSVFPLYHTRTVTEITERPKGEDGEETESVETTSVETYKIEGTSTNVTLDDYDSVSEDAREAGFAFRLNSCLRELSIPRQTFMMSNPVTRKTYFVAYPQASQEFANGLSSEQRRNVDINGGPKPRAVRVLQTCNEFARISFTIEISKIRCLGGETTGGSPGDKDPVDGFIVSNRFWTEESIDSNFYMTRTFTGKLRITTATKTVHYYRDVYYPPLEEGFRRDSVRFSESEDGLELNYVVVDKQVRCSAPYPATSFSGEISYSVDNSAVMSLSFQLSMIGRPDAPKKALVFRCIEAFLNKANQINKNGVSGVIQNFTVAESLGDPPAVTLNAKMLLTSLGSTDMSSPSQVTQITLPGISALGDPLEWENMQIGDKSYEYTRTKSEIPNPYGYDVYYVYDEDDNSSSDGRIFSTGTSSYGGAPSGGGKSGTKGFSRKNLGQHELSSKSDSNGASSGNNSGSGTSGESASSGSSSGSSGSSDSSLKGSDYSSEATHGFIKCLATVPCVVHAPRYINDTTFVSEIDLARTTKVTKNRDGTTYGTPTTSGAQDGAVEFPYTLYKSDITYYTDYARMALPQAFPVESTFKSKVTNWDIPGFVRETEVDGSSLDMVLLYIERLKAKETEYMRKIGEEGHTEEEIESFNSNLADVRIRLAEYQDLLSTHVYNTRIVQVAKPIPKAHVVIEAERFGRMPEMPDPEAIVQARLKGETLTPETGYIAGFSTLVFTCLKSEVKICDPRPSTLNKDGVSYYVIGMYEYAMSRPYNKGDEIWLLENPVFGANCYYPKRYIQETNSYVSDPTALKVLYDGSQLTHTSDLVQWEDVEQAEKIGKSY